MRSIFGDLPKKVILLCLGIFLFLLFFHRGIETEDVWLHLSVGQWIVHHLQVPHENTFPFAHEKTPYLCHEWLASSLIYLAYKAAGFTGLKLIRSLFFMLSIGIFFVYSYRRLPFSFLIFTILLMAYALFQRCLLRPDTCNILFVQLFLISLFSYERNGGRWKLWILPLIGVLWINLHMMGAFIYGGSILFIFFLSALIRGFKKEAQELSLTLLVFLAAFAITPYGLESLVFPYKVLLFPKYYGFYKMVSITAELQHSTYIFFSFDYIYFILLILLPFLLLFLNKKTDLTLKFLFIFALIAFLQVTRNSSFFTLVAVYTIAQGAQNIGFVTNWGKERWSAVIDSIIVTGVAVFLIINSFNFLNERVYANGKKDRALFSTMNPYVISTIDLLKDNHISGPVFNCTLLGGAIIWFDYPALRPFDEGRHLDYGRFNDAISVLLDPKENWPAVEKKYGLKIVILSEGFNAEKSVIDYIRAQDDWQLIAVKGPFVVYVKRGAFPLPEELNKYEERLKADILTADDLKQLKILSQKPQERGVEGLFNPSALSVDLFFDGVTLMGLGYKGAAAKDFMEALKISNQSYMQDIVNVFLRQAYDA